MDLAFGKIGRGPRMAGPAGFLQIISMNHGLGVGRWQDIMDPVATRTVRRIGIPSLIRETVKAVIVGFHLTKSVLLRNPFRGMALRAGRQGDPFLVHGRIGVHLGLDPMNAVAGRAGGRVRSPPGCKNPVNAAGERLCNLRVAVPARLRDIRSKDRGFGINQGSQVVAAVAART